MDSQKLAKDIIQHVGGKENISHLEHCVTRLRFTLKDNQTAHTDVIKQFDDVMTVVISGGQYQVVIGNKVKEVYKEVINILGVSYAENEDSSSEEADAPKKNLFNRFIDVIVGIISPVIGIMAASGITKGLLALATAMNWLSKDDGTYILLNALGDGLFYFLPILIGFSAGKKFKGNPYIPAVIGAALVYPSIVTAFNEGASLHFAGMPVVLANYTSSLFPIILAAWIAAKLEKWFERKLPSSIKLFFVPLFTMLITGIVTFLAVGPVLSAFSQLLADATMAIYNLSPIIAGVVLGGLWQLIVIFGLHYAFIPVLINNITTMHADPVNAILNVTVFAQAGAALGVLLKAKSQKVRSVAGPATISALFGVTEPAIYGISLPYKKPFIMAGIGGALAGGITAFMGAKMFGFGGSAVFAAPLFINPEGIDSSFYAFLISSAVALLVATVLTYFFGFNKSMETMNASASNAVENTSVVSPPTINITATSSSSNVKQVYSPLQGTIIPLQEVKDEAFASGALGDGFAIIPTSNEVYAPVDGTIVTIAKSKHAIAVLSDTGIELLIHVGINTVKLKGIPFDIKVAENETVKKGQLLAVVNWDIIKENNYDITTPVIVTNTAEHNSIELQEVGKSNVSVGQLVLNIK